MKMTWKSPDWLLYDVRWFN